MKSVILRTYLALSSYIAVLAIAYSLAHAASTVTSTTTLAGSGVPTLSCNPTSGNVGRIYIRTDAQALYSSLYVCAQYAAGKYRWEGPYGPNMLIADPNTIQIHSVIATPTGINIR